MSYEGGVQADTLGSLEYGSAMNKVLGNVRDCSLLISGMNNPRSPLEGSYLWRLMKAKESLKTALFEADEAFFFQADTLPDDVPKGADRSDADCARFCQARQKGESTLKEIEGQIAGCQKQESARSWEAAYRSGERMTSPVNVAAFSWW
jgi:hypothetical protein